MNGPASRGDLRVLAALALATVLLHLPFLGRYGYHGDELYFLSCGARPDLGYVDHAPLVPLLAAAVHGVFGDSLFALRLLPLLAGAATVFVTGLLCRELGGGRFAMALSAVAVMLAPVFLRLANTFAIPSFEGLYWTLCSLLLVRIVQGQRPRLWLAFGVAAGIGLLNKHTMLLYGFAVVVGLCATRHRRQLATRWPWLGGAIAFAIFAPNLLWQALHGWPTIEFARNLNQTTMAGISRVDFLLGQALYAGMQNLLVWLPGLVLLLRRAEGAGRILGIAYCTVIGALLVLQSKIYYSMPIYPVLFAAGGVFWERRLRSTGGRTLLVSLLALVGAAFAPVGVPVLPIEDVDEYAASVTMGLAGKAHEITGDLHFMFGWEDMATGVRAAYRALPEATQERCVLLVGSYARAGALERFGPGDQLPPILCNHMSWHFWSRDYLRAQRESARNGDVVLYLGKNAESLSRLYESVVEVASVPGSPHANSGDRDLRLYLCERPREPLADRWPGKPSL